MFKFARYFFVVFLITTVIPLVLMFSWNFYQMEKMQKEREQHILTIGIKQLKNSTEQYLKIRESYILEKIQNLSPEKISTNELERILKADKVERTYSYNTNLITSYYEIIKSNNSGKPELYNVSIIPLKGSKIKGIKIAEKVNLSQLRPQGPFILEIYLGNQINKGTFMCAIEDPFMPSHAKHGLNHMQSGPPPHDLISPPPDDFMHSPSPPNFGPQSDNFGPPPHDFNPDKQPLNDNIKPISNSNQKVKILDNSGKTVATLVIKLVFPEKPFSPKNPIENEFGLIVLLAGSVLSLSIGFYINKNFINPLLVLSNASKKVQNGNLSFELKTDIKQEQILNTFNNFNQMIKGLNEKDKLRKSFISSLTHDLRTPLIAQERSLEFISKKFESLGLKDDYDLAKSLEKNNKHLLRMVNLILESYRFDSEALNLIISDINISELIDNCYEKLKSLAAEKNIQLLNNISKDFPIIHGDITSFKRIFLNLISNAIENITQNGKIQINAEINDNFIKITVEDNGPGISQKDITYIFDRYYTGKSFERKIGSGLGLYVCKKLTEMHEGEISVESEINKYTRFTIKLPLNV